MDFNELDSRGRSVVVERVAVFAHRRHARGASDRCPGDARAALGEHAPVLPYEPVVCEGCQAVLNPYCSIDSPTTREVFSMRWIE